MNYFLGRIIRFYRRIRINSNNPPGKLRKLWKNVKQRQKGKQFRGENVAGTSESVIHQKGATVHVCFVNKCDNSTITDLEILRITAIYKDKNEIPACFGF